MMSRIASASGIQASSTRISSTPNETGAFATGFRWVGTGDPFQDARMGGGMGGPRVGRDGSGRDDDLRRHAGAQKCKSLEGVGQRYDVGDDRFERQSARSHEPDGR